MTHPIPVTLLTGFLGAGKTTILNHLLHDPSAGRVAVVVNEFGEAGLDHDLIEEAAEDVVLMPAGCICCTIRGDLTRTLISLLARRTRGELPFDRVVIEATGLADPGPIHHTLLVDRVLAPNFALDGIVTAVDAVLGTSTLQRHEEAQTQVAMADRIVLTKCDLADNATIKALAARLDQLNPGARRITANKGAVPSGELFGIGALRRSIEPDHALNWLAAPAPAADPLAGLSGMTLPKKDPILDLAAPSHHASDDRIATASITIDEPIPAQVFDFWLDTLISLRGPDILRMKGIVHIEDVPKPFVFHGVQHIFEPPVPLESWPDGNLTSRVVVIARDISKADLEESLSVLHMRPKQGDDAGGLSEHSLPTP
ncbi:GTP-binding protein [Lentibacter algarum]|uniref:CobW family GTP-binding protein n=1 Tax=Lentibacter algarum TaxID=576131 RepID=UPI001C083350|nr:GTP-binding protein [Lentibacter algarum]MBU2983175.1 GTP-binding protein [Lentibacter algarum]